MLVLILDPEEHMAKLDEKNYIPSEMLIKALNDFKAVALKFSVDCIHDAKIRQQYINGIRRMSDAIYEAVIGHEMVAQEGAKVANSLRNAIMLETRAVSSAGGRTVAEILKKTGQTLDESLEKYSARNFEKTFNKLTPEEKSIVYYDVIKGSGGSRVSVTSTVPKIAIASKVCIYITIGLAIYNVIEAESPSKEAWKQSAQMGGVLAGSYMGAEIGAALAPGGVYCGDFAPLCAAGIFLLCTGYGAWAGERAATGVMHYFDEELEEFLKWKIF